MIKCEDLPEKNSGGISPIFRNEDMGPNFLSLNEKPKTDRVSSRNQKPLKFNSYSRGQGNTEDESIIRDDMDSSKDTIPELVTDEILMTGSQFSNLLSSGNQHLL